MPQKIQVETIYKINLSEIAQETIDGEVIIINLNKGHYFSLNGNGADIWLGINLGMPGSAIISKLKLQYNDTENVVEESVKKILQELLDEELIIMSDNTRNNHSDYQDIILSNNVNDSKKYIIPVLEKYTDMEDLLLLDPIHEVDEMGWPNMTPIISEEKK